MHDEFIDGEPAGGKGAYRLGQDSSRDAAPPGVHHRDDARRMRDEYRNTVGDGHGRGSSVGEQVPVGTVDADPPVPRTGVDQHPRAMDLPS